MKQITLNIADNKFKAFLEFIKTLDYVKVKDEGDSKESPYDPEFVAKIEESREQYKKGEFISVEKKDIKSFLGL
ncbi:hypothetical protein C900_00514 [Fulvivirga imtechensis AK7]|uniref:Uncharacterized protein n=2 Tax=Fulvivirga TaxID=396811 RepID=L8JJD3_9BACT|nr:hypothetical protein C900_00514 [Fulvivirga imtechensis AK7]